MPSETIQAVVLRYANYREHDRMLTLLSPEGGRVDALARGCRRPKSPLLPASEMFSQGEFVLFRSADRYTLTSCALTDTFYPLRLEPYRLTCATYASQLCCASAQPGQPARELYALLLQALYRLAYLSDADPLLTVDEILLRFAAAGVYRPRLNHCVRCRRRLDPEAPALLDIEGGGLVCADCAPGGAYRLTAAQTGWMRDVLSSPDWLARPTDARALFTPLRRYVESRMEAPVKAGRLLP